MFMYRSRFYIFMISTWAVQGQTTAWEYALSDSEFHGSIMNGVLILEDAIILGGARSTCREPTIWVLEKTGELRTHKRLKIPAENYEYTYKYWSVTGLKFSKEREKIYAIGNVAIADDVGGHTAVIYIRFGFRDRYLLWFFISVWSFRSAYFLSR